MTYTLDQILSDKDEPRRFPAGTKFAVYDDSDEITFTLVGDHRDKTELLLCDDDLSLGYSLDDSAWLIDEFTKLD